MTLRRLPRTLFFPLILLFSLLAVGCDEPKLVEVPVGDQTTTALFWAPPRDQSPAVLLVHMLGRGKEDWVVLAGQLRQAGYGVLALDLREQGRGGGPQTLEDVRAGFTYLREQMKVDAARIGIAGASIGANAALLVAAEDPLVRVTVLLSPGLNFQGLATVPALREYGARPLLLLAAETDLVSARAVRRLQRSAQGEVFLKFYPGQAHGTDLLESGPPVAQEVLAFLRAHL